MRRIVFNGYRRQRFHSDEPVGVGCCVFIAVVAFLIGLDFAFGFTADTICTVMTKKHWVSCDDDGHCTDHWDLKVMCGESTETASASKYYWKARQPGDDVPVHIRTSRVLGLKWASTNEDE